MQSLVPDAWRPLLDVLQSTNRPLAQHEIAVLVDLSRSTVLRHLANMEQAGFVRRKGVRQGATYTLAEHAHVIWIANKSGRWNLAEWTAMSQIDWMFPLVQRIPDELARATVLRFLHAAWNAGLFTPWFLVGRAKDHITGPEHLDLKDPAIYGGLTVCVFGSCARGEARSDSDVDVALILPGKEEENRYLDYKETWFKDLAIEVGLGAARPIDLHVLHRDRINEWPTSLKTGLGMDGLTVFSTVRGGEYVELLEELDGA